MLPTAAHVNRFAAPDSRRAVKVKKAARAIARCLFDYEMAVQHDRLQARQQIVRAIDVRPTHLRAAHQGISKVVDELPQKVRFGNKVSIEDRH